MKAQDRVYLNRRQIESIQRETRKATLVKIRRIRTDGIIVREDYRTFDEYIAAIEQAVRKLQGKDNA